jgi:hypothetical protein
MDLEGSAEGLASGLPMAADRLEGGEIQLVSEVQSGEGLADQVELGRGGQVEEGLGD